MADPTRPQNAAQKSAQTYFTKEQQQDSTAKQLYKKQRAADAAKTAKLRELRLAKEFADKETIRIADEANGTSPAPARRKRAPKAKGFIRMTY